jgi:uncharacterized repeat protein (TIGR03803 family)
VNKINGWKRICAVFLICGATTISMSAQTFKSLVSFDGSNGGRPDGALIQATDGEFYGTTSNLANTNCSNGCGTVFKITAAGTLTTLHMFNGTDGGQSIGGLIQGTDGNFYGTTEMGGNLSCFPNYGCGTVFKMTAGGMLTTLHSFDGTDGKFPYADLVEAVDGSLYGTTNYGGVSDAGTVFKITPAGLFTTLYSFCAQTNCPDGSIPMALVQATNGNFYGTTYGGGASNDGTVFKITAGGKLTTLHSFDGTDGSLPGGALIQATDGNFYGTTVTGGIITGPCTQQGCGTIFKITPQGMFATAHRFCPQNNCADGFGPESGLVQATDGNFYGSTGLGGPSGSGTLFKITSGGVLTTLHAFDNTDGSQPVGTLLQATTGNFYGTTYEGGPNFDGTVFGLRVGLGPFVETNPAMGKVGRVVGILGNGLKGTTSVSFNGTLATFTVKSGTYIKAAVPTGATTGYVTVSSPSGTLTSNVPFHVIP